MPSVIRAAAGAGLGGYRMSRRTAGVSEFQFEPIGGNHQQVRLQLQSRDRLGRSSCYQKLGSDYHISLVSGGACELPAFRGNH